MKRRCNIILLECISLVILVSMGCHKDSKKNSSNPVEPTSAATKIVWEKMDGPYAGSVLSIAVASNGDLVAGTWQGVFLSTDHGESWKTTSMTHAAVALAVLNNGHILAGCGRGATGIHRSTDNGQNWSESGLTESSISTIAANAQGHIFAGSAHGIYRSMDNAENWTAISSGLTDDEIHCLAVAPNGHLFAGSSHKGVFHSTNNGDTWEQTPLGDKSIGALVVDKNGHLFASGNEYIFRSIDDGASWTQLRNGLTDNNINCLAIDADGILFASAYSREGALHRSADNGDSWEHIGEGLIINTILCHSHEIYIGANGCGLFFSSDKGDNWTQRNKGFPEPRINAIAINNSDHIFVASDGSGIYRSMDDGATWQQVNSGLSPAAHFYPDVIACGDNGTLFMGCSRVFKSEDNGDSWVAVSDYISHDVVSIVLNPEGDIFAVGDDYGTGFFRSVDGGNSWVQHTNGLEEVFPWAFEMDRDTGDLFYGTSQGLYVSRDNGASWQGTNLKEPMILALAVNPSGHIFAGTDDGLYRSKDHGANWTALKNGFPWSPWILSIEIKKNGIVLVGSTDGVFVSGDNGESWTQSSGVQAAALATNSRGTVFAGSRFGGVYKGAEE